MESLKKEKKFENETKNDAISGMYISVCNDDDFVSSHRRAGFSDMFDGSVQLLHGKNSFIHRVKGFS